MEFVQVLGSVVLYTQLKNLVGPTDTCGIQRLTSKGQIV